MNMSSWLFNYIFKALKNSQKQCNLNSNAHSRPPDYGLYYHSLSFSERNQGFQKKWLIHLGRKETKWAWYLLLYQKTREPAKINGTVPNRSRSQCGKATTPGQSCDHLDLKENNEFSGLKQIESMKNRWVHNDTIKEKVIEITFVTIWGKYLHNSSLWKLGNKEKQLIIYLSFWWQLVLG